MKYTISGPVPLILEWSDKEVGVVKYLVDRKINNNHLIWSSSTNYTLNSKQHQQSWDINAKVPHMNVEYSF